MKRALIVAAMGILASTGWAVSANAQANMNPNLYPNRAAAAQQGWEWAPSAAEVEGRLTRGQAQSAALNP